MANFTWGGIPGTPIELCMLPNSRIYTKGEAIEVFEGVVTIADLRHFRTRTLKGEIRVKTEMVVEI